MHPTVATRSGLCMATPSVAKDMPSMDCDDDFKNYASNAGCPYTLAKPGQILALKHILSGADVLAVLPCGGGKTTLPAASISEWRQGRCHCHLTTTCAHGKNVC